MSGNQKNVQYRSFTKEQILDAVSEISDQYKKKNPNSSEWRITDSEFNRMALTISQIPVADTKDSHIVDLGATVLWVPLYYKLLDYKKITIVRRGAEEWLTKFDFSFLPDATVTGCNAELDIERYNLDDRSVNCVVCFEVLEHLFGDPMHMMSEVNRILKTDGYLVMSTPNLLHRKNMLEIFRGAHPYGWSKFTLCYGDRHNREWTPFELEKLFDVSGFGQIDVFTDDIPGGRQYRGIKMLVFKFVVDMMCYVSSVVFSVPMKYRNNLLFGRGRRKEDIRERFPSQFYDKFGRDEMIYPIIPK